MSEQLASDEIQSWPEQKLRGHTVEISDSCRRLVPAVNQRQKILTDMSEALWLFMLLALAVCPGIAGSSL